MKAIDAKKIEFLLKAIAAAGSVWVAYLKLQERKS